MNDFILNEESVCLYVIKNVLKDIQRYDNKINIENIKTFENHKLVVISLELHTHDVIKNWNLKNIHRFTNDNEKEKYFIGQNSIFISNHPEINYEFISNAKRFRRFLLKNYIIFTIVKKYFGVDYSGYVL